MGLWTVFSRGCTAAISFVALVGCCATTTVQSFPPRYRVCQNEGEAERCGLIDELGDVKVPFELSKERFVSEFSEGRSLVRNAENEYGWLDAEGVVVVEPKYLFLCFPAEGLACFYAEAGCGFVDINGKEVIAAQWDRCGRFKEGQAAIDIDECYGYIGRDGEITIKPLYVEAGDFSEQRALVRLAPSAPKELREKLGMKYGFIDLDGNPITQFEFDRAESFQNGMAVVARKVGEEPYDDETGVGVEDVFAYGYINADGELVWPMEFTEAKSFNTSGFAPAKVCDPDGECRAGMIRKDGTWQLEPKYDTISEFSEGLAHVMWLDDGWMGYVNTHGDKVFAARGGSGFVNGVATVLFSWKEECGPVLVDITGQPIFPFRAPGADTESGAFDENQVLVAPIDVDGVEYHELVLHRERGVIWPPGWNTPGAGEGVLCWPELEAETETGGEETGGEEE